jgi:hypothetical protein
MKKITLLFVSLILFYSCLDSDIDTPNLAYEILPIDEYTTPDSFTFGQRDTIKLKYSLPNGCYYFNDIYYEYQDTARVVAIRSIKDKDLDAVCTEAIIQYDYDLIVTATQAEDYLFKFYKGEDANGDSIFEEVVVPVN